MLAVSRKSGLHSSDREKPQVVFFAPQRNTARNIFLEQMCAGGRRNAPVASRQDLWAVRSILVFLPSIVKKDSSENLD